MFMSNGSQTPSVPRWQAVNAKLIAFLLNPQSALENNWWVELTGGEPETTKKRGYRLDDGKFQGYGLQLEVDALRAIWTSGVYLEAGEFPPAIPTLGDFKPAFQEFRDLMRRWLTSPTCPQIYRLAFVGSLFLPQTGRREAYQKTGEFIRHINIDPDSFDFQYRINRRRDSTVIPQIKINRLCGWSILQFRVEARTTSGVAPANVISEAYGCHLEFDVNTSQDNTVAIQQDQLPMLFDELVALTDQIAEQGDIP